MIFTPLRPVYLFEIPIFHLQTMQAARRREGPLRSLFSSLFRALNVYARGIGYALYLYALFSAGGAPEKQETSAQV